MSSSEEETSLIKTPRRSATADQGHSSSEKAKAERLRRQKELQEAFKERMREKESQKMRKKSGEEEVSQSILEDPPQEKSQVSSRSYLMLDQLNLFMIMNNVHMMAKERLRVLAPAAKVSQEVLFMQPRIRFSISSL